MSSGGSHAPEQENLVQTAAGFLPGPSWVSPLAPVPALPAAAPGRESLARRYPQAWLLFPEALQAAPAQLSLQPCLPALWEVLVGRFVLEAPREAPRGLGLRSRGEGGGSNSRHRAGVAPRAPSPSQFSGSGPARAGALENKLLGWVESHTLYRSPPALHSVCGTGTRHCPSPVVPILTSLQPGPVASWASAQPRLTALQGVPFRTVKSWETWAMGCSSCHQA